MTSIPSANFTPWISFGNWLWPSIRRQLFWAPSTSLKTMASAVLFDRQPFDRIVRCQTVAKVLSMGFRSGTQSLSALKFEAVRQDARGFGRCAPPPGREKAWADIANTEVVRNLVVIPFAGRRPTATPHVKAEVF